MAGMSLPFQSCRGWLIMGPLKCLSREFVTNVLVMHLHFLILRLSADTIRHNWPFSRHIYLLNMKARDSIIFFKGKLRFWRAN